MISAETAAGVGYYAGGGGSNDARDASGRNYYTGAVDHGERPGYWSGTLAQARGLVGIVDPTAMESVFGKFIGPDGQPIGNAPRNYKSVDERLAAALAKEPDALPERIEAIRSKIEGSDASTCQGMDLTFSVAKSVTVAYVAVWRAEQEAEQDGRSADRECFAAIREAIDGAILGANQVALDYVAGIATTRLGWHGSGHAGQWVASPGLVVASFPQLTSRADDPQYHIHNVVLNRAQTEDGKVGALDTRDLRQQRAAYSVVADRVLAENLQDLGITMATRPDGKAREIVGIDEETLHAVSQRRAQIVKAMDPIIREQEERLGRELNALERHRLGQTINLVTRESKDEKDIDWSAKLEHWQDRITDEIGRGLGPIAMHVRAMVEDSIPSASVDFSPDAVIAQAIHTAAMKNAAWTRADLVRAIDEALPDRLGLPAAKAVGLIDRLADAALASDSVVQVAGNPGVLPPPGLVVGSFTRPSDAKYAAPETIESENLILRTAMEHGRGPTGGMGEKTRDAWSGRVHAWLDEHFPTILPDQRATVVGLASTDAALSQLVGPAGTGKSFTAGALAGAWGALSGGGRVIGLATSKVAAEVLKEDGVADSFTISAWRAMQGRIASGNLRGDEITLTDRDLVVIDEASMVSTANVTTIRDAVDAAGARTVAMGDPAQLGAIGAGGIMELLIGRAETYTLSDVMRFNEDWERPASLGLRDGSTDALREYDLHGRLVEVDTMENAMSAAAKAAVAERLSGHTVSVTADTNVDAYRIGDMVREHLVSVGHVEEQGIILARSGQVVGIGDDVMTRQIDYDLGVLNGSHFEVVGTGDDGSLSVRGEDGVVRELPSQYVTEHVHLGYASTVHGSQGKTVDNGFTVTGGNTSASALYVGMTRGRDRNTAFVALAPTTPPQGRVQSTTERGGELRVEDPHARASAVSVLSDILARESQSRAALTELARDTARLASMDTLMGRIEEATHLACRARLDGDLDRLVEDGTLSDLDRAALAADQSTDHLSRVCRAAEQAGLNPRELLREAIDGRSFEGARSVAQVTAGRITSKHDVAAAQPGAFVVPERLAAEDTRYLETLHEQAQDRARDLGSQAAQDAPAWAVRELGNVPDDAMARLEWEGKAGAIASYREAKGLDGERALSAAPGLSQTEARAAWWGAWEALGRPQETRVEAALTDGALQVRVAAWQREQAWAPAHANASLRQAELDAEEARHEAALARAGGNDTAASRWEEEAAERGAVADAMAVVADARGVWAEETAVTQDVAERAAAELRDRQLEVGHEPDRVSAEEWLEHQREADTREDEHRDVTELDVPLDETVDTAYRGVEDGATDVSGETQDSSGSGHSPEASGHSRDLQDEQPGSGTAGRGAVALEADGSSEGDAPTSTPASSGWLEQSEIPGSASAVSPSDDARETNAPDDDHATGSGEHAEKPTSEDKSPAHRVAPIEPDDAELAALVATARAAQDRAADRASEEAAHEAMEAEQTAAPETEGSSGTADEAYSASVLEFAD